MKNNFRLLALLLIAVFSDQSFSAEKPSTLALVGRWEGVIEFGKTSFRLNLKVAPDADGKRVKVTLDNPDQGMSGMPVSAILYNHPEVRVEFDQFGTAYNGRLNEAGDAIAGEFEEGPTGKPMGVTFRKNLQPEPAELPLTHTFAPGEAVDPRGYWLGVLQAAPDMRLRIGLKIGRLGDGTFRVLMDSFDQGLEEIAASKVEAADGGWKIEWGLFRATLEARLAAEGSEFSGTWKQGPLNAPVVFKRLAKPATGLPEGFSAVPETVSRSDIRGQWDGVLEAQGGKLRLSLKVGTLPDGSFSGTMRSLDQGGGELLASSVGYTNPVVRMEWKAIRGVYTGEVNETGTEVEGTWEQFGRPLPLKLKRAIAVGADKAEKPGKAK